MNTEIKAKWVEALRSGEYVQGEGALKRKSEAGVVEHCCLGVLCELAIEDGVSMQIGKGEFESGYGNWAFDGEGAFLPSSVTEWSGMDSINGAFGEDTLASHNDSGYSFSAIADLIEEHF